MICYLDSCRDKTLKLCTPEKFRELTESQRTAMLIESYRSGQNPDAKSQLSAFVFQGYDPKILTDGVGSRLKSSMVSTGFGITDFDHLKEQYNLTPYEAYDRFLKVMPKLGLTLEHDLVLAHVTPSGNGLRTVFKLRKGKTVAQMQKLIGDALGIECDKAVKDLSRLSFCPKSDDILYINKSLLFAPIQTTSNNLQTTSNNNTNNDSNKQDTSSVQVLGTDENTGRVREETQGTDSVQTGKQAVDTEAGAARCDSEKEADKSGHAAEEGSPNGGTRNEHEDGTGRAGHGNEVAATASAESGAGNRATDEGQRPVAGGEGNADRTEGVREVDSNGRPLRYRGIPYKEIVEKWIQLRGGVPEPGDRHATLIALAMDLRKICDNDKDWMASLMPDFDKGEEEKQDAIEWAVSQKPTLVNGTLKEVLKAFGIERNTEIQTDRNTETVEYKDGEGLPPAMPEKLPKLVELLTSKVLPHQKPALSAMIFPALAVHVNNCLFKLRDNTDVELSLMCCLLAQQSVGKGCVKTPLRLIMNDIKAEDKINRQRERQWQESQKNKKANEKGASRPDDIVIRILSSDTTPAAFLGRLMAAEHGDGNNPNLCTYSQVDEIEDLYRFCASGGRNMVQQMIKRTWDRDEIGAERWSANSANISTVLRWNWAASSTIEGGKKFFRNCLTDGTTSRVDFCTIIPPTKVIDFCYGDYDEEFEEALRPYIHNLKTFECEKAENGKIIPRLFPEIRAIEEKMNVFINDYSSSQPDSTWENYAWRAKLMAIKKLIVLYIANGQQWEPEFEPFVWWSFHYGMWCKMNLFYDAAAAQFADEQLRGTNGQRTPLKEMTRTFTLAQFAAKCQQYKVKTTPTTILSKYKNRGIVAQNGDMYVINPEWAKKNGIREA